MSPTPVSVSSPLFVPPRSRARFALHGVTLLSTLVLAACGGGGSSDSGPVAASAATAATASATTSSTSSTDRATTEKLAGVSAFDVNGATKIADENNSFTLTAAATVYWGANGTFRAVQLAAGTYRAVPSLLGDPVPGVYKALYVVGNSAIKPFSPNDANAIMVAGEGQTFTLTTAGTVYYGAADTFTGVALQAGVYTANNSTFGGDPIPNVYKSAYVVSTVPIAPFDVSTATRVANEGAQFTLTSAGTVYFGANGQFSSQSLAAGTYYASTALFGDPISGVYKAAYVIGTSSITPFDAATAIKVADEGIAFTLTSAGTVFFGANGAFTSRQLAAGNYTASTSLFGDPAPGVFKTAYVTDPSLIVAFNPATAVKLADENNPFYISAPATVYFGANNSFTSKMLAAGTYWANSAEFGDPAPGNFKAAYAIGTSAIPQFDAGSASKIADENTQFTLAYPTVVFFGTGTTYHAFLLQPGSYTANRATFGDPAPGLAKAAYVLSTLDQGPVAPTPPTITTQPTSTAVFGGGAATFTVVATSETNVKYQWFRNSVAMANATASSYTLPTVQLADTGTRFSVSVTNNAGTTQSAAAVLTVNAGSSQTASFLRPFSDQSLWNSRPTQVTLGTFQIPSSYYYPTVAEGSLSTGAFNASASDPAATVYGPDDSTGLSIADAEQFVPSLTIPHWPANLVPASGGDGHADIVDVAANKIHSFYQLKRSGDKWRATLYTWTALDGRGFGTPGQYYQGSRATGVVPMAGIIRTPELTDGLPAYKHALAMSMPTNALSANPTYTFPATSADGYASSVNTGSIPEGALMMLPADFDLSKIKDPRLLKIVRTLQSYGAYAVDGNTGTPFVIYVEIGSNFQLMQNGWDPEIAAELDLIRSSLRQAVGTSGWVDANGAPFVPETNLNLLSMRGSWYVLQGSTAGTFNTWDQAVTFPDNGRLTVQLNSTGRSIPSSLWGSPQANKAYRLQVTASGGATMQFALVNSNGQHVHQSAALGDGTVHIFNWPAGTVTPYLQISSGPNGGGKISATLLAQ